LCKSNGEKAVGGTLMKLTTKWKSKIDDHTENEIFSYQLQAHMGLFVMITGPLRV
jgi:hypothetical protein